MRTKLKLNCQRDKGSNVGCDRSGNGSLFKSSSSLSSPFSSSLCSPLKLLPLTKMNLVAHCFILFVLLLNGFSYVESKSSWPSLLSSASSTASSSPSSSSSSSLSFQCGTSQFNCGENCIPLTWKCDGDNDCKNGSDEKDCPPKATCEKNEFQCKNNGKCIPVTWRCDEEDDCGDKSDEMNCNRTCPMGQFACHSRGNNCISAQLKCDGKSDCADGSDEFGCQVQCTELEFRCDNGLCVDKSFVCDQDYDCPDASDEKGCPETTCAANQFTCGDGKCIPDLWKCDGNMDCKDESDELHCPNATVKSNRPSLCNTRSFKCEDSLECIHIDWKCDGSKDCKDGSDEKGCLYNTTCRADQFRCNVTGQCIPSYMRCNGAHECTDHSDEFDCDTFLPQTCGPDFFRCNSTNKCIIKDKVCDRDNDCDDWSDEPASCNINECAEEQNHCSHECIDDPIGFHCACPRGYRLGNDSWTCHDIDECSEIFGICSNHKCINTKGHFKCECLEGFQLVDHRYCRVKGYENPLLVFANRHDIRQAHLPANRSEPKHYAPLFRDLGSAIAIDYNLRGNYLIWSDGVQEEIMIGKLKKGDSKYAKENATVLISTAINSVSGLAIDWVHDLLYWTDDVANTIEVAQVKNPLNRKVIVDVGLDEPRAIVIDVKESIIVWADWGDKPVIERASQDGSNRRKLVDQNILWPNALTLDIITKKIYWLDVKFHTLSAINYDGTGRITLFESPTKIDQPFSVDVFEDYLYFSDWKLEAIQRININDEPRKADTFLSGLVESPMGVKIVHSSKQPSTQDRCKSARCTQLCLPSAAAANNNYRCFCRNGYELSHDGYTCESTTKVTPSPTAGAAAIKSSPTTRKSSTLHLTKTISVTTTTFSPTSDNSDSSHWSSSTTESERAVVTEDQTIPKPNRTSMDSFNFSENTNVVLNSSAESYSETDAHLAFIIIAICLTIALFITLLTFIIHRNYQRRNMTSMNFDNPVYRKTTEEQFVLEKSEDSVNSYPSSLEPLNSPGTNEFV